MHTAHRGPSMLKLITCFLFSYYCEAFISFSEPRSKTTLDAFVRAVETKLLPREKKNDKASPNYLLESSLDLAELLTRALLSKACPFICTCKLIDFAK